MLKQKRQIKSAEYQLRNGSKIAFEGYVKPAAKAMGKSSWIDPDTGEDLFVEYLDSLEASRARIYKGEDDGTRRY